MSRPIKAAALICVLCLAFCISVIPAFAAGAPEVISFSSITPTIVDQGDNVYSFKYRLPIRPLWQVFRDGVKVFQSNTGLSYKSGDVGTADPELYRIRLFTTGVYPSTGYAEGPVFDVTDFKRNSTISIDFGVQIRLDVATGGSSTLTFRTLSEPQVYWYDANFSCISVSTLDSVTCTYGAESPITIWPLRDRFQMTIPADAAYFVPVATVRVYDPDAGSITAIDSTQNEIFEVTINKDMIVDNSDTMYAIENQLKELNDNVSDTNEKLDDTNDKLDQIIEQPENEKEEASNEGGELADQLTGAMPDKSQGFMAALKELAGSMSYDGTEASLTFPAIVIPGIPGLFGSFQLSQEQKIDFSFWIQKLPGPILTLVQIVLTIALVVFCFKELYGMISYAMTLRGGSN